MLQIELGHGDKLVTDIYDDANGNWAGIAISEGSTPVGEFAETGVDRVNELDPEITIITSNPASLDVIIQACERAKKHLATYQPCSRVADPAQLRVIE
ncbi:MAG: hypothetical protein ACKVJE_17145 [Pseudomonadales bacterium]